MRFRDIVFPEGGKVRNTLRDVNKKIKVVLKAPEESKDTTYWKIMERLEPKPKELKNQKKTKFKIQPKISIVVIDSENATLKNKRTLLKSIKKQTYSNWEICNLNKLDVNKINNIVTGDYITIIGTNDILPRFCLYEFVKAINQCPKMELIYSDADHFIKNLQNRIQPEFKPDFSMDLLRCNNYIYNMFLAKKELLKKIDDSKSIYDLIFRLCEKTDQIGHIQKVLYHSRIDEIQNKIDSKEDIEAIEAHLQRVNLKGQAKETTIDGIYDVKYEVIGAPKVTILIPNKDEKETLQTCINSILNKTTYENFEIAIIENNSTSKEIFDYYNELEQNDKIQILKYPKKEFNYSKIINYGVKNTDGEFIIQLNNDTELITKNWIEKMIGYAQRKEVGAVGVRLYYPDMSLQHGGVVLGLGGVAGHRFLYLPKDKHANFNLEMKTSDLVAVTAACIASRREVYEKVGYMNEDLAVAFNDVDFCLKIREAGLKIIYNPFVEILHYESKTRGKENSPEKQQRFSDEIDTFMRKWGGTVGKGDPYYNKNFYIPEMEVEENTIQTTI